jgi:predicted P-loop ATPase
MAEFLTDETGSVRWLCFEIKNIDWTYKDKVEINKCWAQAYGMYSEGLEVEMNKDEIEANEKRNSKFQQLSSEAEMIPHYLKASDEKTLGALFLSATEILIYLTSFTTIRLNRVMIGRAMPICGFTRAKDSAQDRYGYWCVKLK